MLIVHYALTLAALFSFSAVPAFAQSTLPPFESPELAAQQFQQQTQFLTIIGIIIATGSAVVAVFAVYYQRRQFLHAREADTKNLQLHILDRIFQKYSDDKFKKARHDIIAEYIDHLNEDQKKLNADDYFEKYLKINLLEKNGSLEMKTNLELTAREMAQIAIMINPEQNEGSEIEKLYFNAFWNSILRVWPAMDGYLKFMGPVTGNMDYGKFFRSQVSRAHKHWKKHNQNSTIKYYDLDEILSD